jgi:hypothetical protein
LNYDYFMRQVGGLEKFKQIMLWLPTWQDAREILRDLTVADEEVAARLREHRAIETGGELLQLYEMIAEALSAVDGPSERLSTIEISNCGK